ncbi:MAG: cobyrinate a,c-diamide synthase [Desulfobacterales bacterium]|nr:cobyrinate a,c-diamide synthase [Desulfobacterales bacterium]
MTSVTGKKTCGLVVAGLRGGSGKSIVAVGLTAALAGRGLSVAPFKKGPDYIDAGWLGLAAGRPCYNLDPFLMSAAVIDRSFRTHSQGADRVVVEGNRGLYDGVDADGVYSTAELAVALDLPVLLVVDCTKSTRTVAALVLGCRELDRRVRISGVILNQLGSSRQEGVIRRAVAEYTGIPVLGAIQRMSSDAFPQRQLGVTPHQEHGGAGHAVAQLADMVHQSLDLAAVEAMMAPISTVNVAEAALVTEPGARVRIGVIKDAAFQFYYPDNLQALEREGAGIVEINALTDAGLPELDGLYIGGGFPENSAPVLSANRAFLGSLRERIKDGLPVYAECGGLIYLGESIELDGGVFPLAGIFPVRFGLARRPQAHGYTVLKVDRANPFYPQGLEIKGHEFRYSSVLEWQGEPGELALEMVRGTGFSGGRDGLVHGNVLALYTHIHSLSTPEWAQGLVARARQYRGGP